jgi:hypothetical protein
MFLLILTGCDGSGVIMLCQLNTEAQVMGEVTLGKKHYSSIQLEMPGKLG